MLTLLARTDKAQRNSIARHSIAGSAQSGRRNNIRKSHCRGRGTDGCFYELPAAYFFFLYHKNASTSK
jgi:hypothetical protein